MTPNEKKLKKQLAEARSEIKKLKARTPPKKRIQKKAAPQREYILLEPDQPRIWKHAGFSVKKKQVYFPASIGLHTLYHGEGICEFYSASFFGGEIHTQLIPLSHLPDFLEQQQAIDDEEGQFYDLITLRENGRSAYERKFESAEELLLWLSQYKRHGALIGKGQSFEYIQVCYIIIQ
jgi:hypothetical protein